MIHRSCYSKQPHGAAGRATREALALVRRAMVPGASSAPEKCREWSERRPRWPDALLASAEIVDGPGVDNNQRMELGHPHSQQFFSLETKVRERSDTVVTVRRGPSDELLKPQFHEVAALCDVDVRTWVLTDEGRWFPVFTRAVPWLLSEDDEGALTCELVTGTRLDRLRVRGPMVKRSTDSLCATLATIENTRRAELV